MAVRPAHLPSRASPKKAVSSKTRLRLAYCRVSAAARRTTLQMLRIAPATRPAYPKFAMEGAEDRLSSSESVQAVAKSTLHLAVLFKLVWSLSRSCWSSAFLLGCRFRDAAQTDLAAVRRGQDNIGALQCGQQRERSHGRERLSVFGAARGELRLYRSPAFEQVLQSDPERVAKNATLTCALTRGSSW
jgi:hypothetical protein